MVSYELFDLNNKTQNNLISGAGVQYGWQ